MNVKLLKKVRDYIAKHPEKYDQSTWCGTACCIAGHAVALGRAATRKEVDHRLIGSVSLSIDAQQLLQLEPSQAHRLFHSSWENVAYGRFRVDFDMPPGKRARIAVRRINHFIRTKGAE